jgi:hypothetical protein
VSKNPYEHFGLFPEITTLDNGQTHCNVTPVAMDLSPDKPVEFRQLDVNEVDEDLHKYLDKALDSMDAVCDVMIHKLVESIVARGDENNEAFSHFGYADLVAHFIQAPPLLTANMLAAMLADCVRTIFENPELLAEAKEVIAAPANN